MNPRARTVISSRGMRKAQWLFGVGVILAILAGGILFFWPFSQLEFLEIETAPPKVAKLAGGAFFGRIKKIDL